MLPFIILIFVPLVIQHAVIDKKNTDFDKKNHAALLFFFVGFAALVALRHETVGKDTASYVYYFDSISKMEWGELGRNSIEIGFTYLIKIVSQVFGNPQYLFIIVAVVSVAMIYRTYKRFCFDPSLTIVLFTILSTFVMMFSGIRQMMSIGVGFVAYEFVRNKKPIPFILAVLLAMSFHTSAFMLAFMYPVYHAKITKKWLLAVVPSLILVFVFNKQIFSVLTMIIERYTKYEGGITTTGAYTMIILFAIFAVFSFAVWNPSSTHTGFILFSS